MIALSEPPRSMADALTPELIRRHQNGVWRYLRLLGCEPSAADDLTQEAFLALLRHPPSSTEPAVVARWLRTTALNLFRNTGRRARQDLPLDEAAIELAWSAHVRSTHGDEVFDDLEHCMAGLPERMRQALTLRYEADGNRRAVATALDLNDEGAKSLLRRARERLARCLQHQKEQR